jgi:Uma2 family endonuclease
MTALLQRRPRNRISESAGAPNRVLLHDIDWQTYLTIADALPERKIRITYDRGDMEIMTVSFMHERYKSLIATLIFAIAVALKRTAENFGSFTHRREDLSRALEPDLCFYLGHFPVVAGKTTIDLEKDPPPDLMVEIEISRSILDRLAILRALQVPEVWRVEQRRVRVLILRQEGYQDVDRSPSFPEIPRAWLSKWLAFGLHAGGQEMAQKVQAWIRTNVKKPKR